MPVMQELLNRPNGKEAKNLTTLMPQLESCLQGDDGKRLSFFC